MNLLRGSRPMTPYDQQFLRDRLRGKSYLQLAYFEGFDRRMVPLGIFQYFKRHPHSDSGRHMGVTNIRKEVHKYGTY